MMDTLTIRFQEYQWWDVAEDCEVCRLTATVGNGTWHATVLVTTARELREDREAFKQYVLGAMQAGLQPCEVQIG